MKKFLFFALVVLVMTAICVFACGFLMTPQAAIVSENMALGNTLYVATTAGGDVKFHMIDEAGQVTQSFATTQEGQLETMMASGEELYVSMRDLGVSTIEKWSSGDQPLTVGVLEQGTTNLVLDMALYQGELYVTGLMADGRSLGVYQLQEGAFVLDQMYNMTDMEIADAIYFNRALLVQGVDGTVYFVDASGSEAVETPVESSGFLIHNGTTLAYYNATANTYTTYVSGEGTIHDVDTAYTLQNAVGGAQLWAVAINNAGYSTLLHVDSTGAVEENIAISGTAKWYMDEGQSLLLPCLSAVVVLVAAFFLSHYIMTHSKRLVLKVLCGTIWYAAFVGFGLYWVEGIGLASIARGTWFVGVLATLSLIYIVCIYRMVAVMGKMATLAEEIYRGNYGRYTKKLTDDEVGRIGRSLNGIAALLEQTEYNNRKTLRVYSRFVPKNIQNMLGKNSTLELESGQATTLTTTIGVVSVSNRHEVRSHMKDETYTGWMMHTLNTINNVAKNHGAVPTGTACTLQGVNLFYPESANDAVTYGIELFSRQRGGDAYGKMPTNYQFFLHYCDAIYGMGGDMDQAFMFLASQELEMLQLYQDRIGTAGVRMVMTEQSKKQISTPVESRYLGFIGEGEMRFKLYEVLNVLGDSERQLKLQTAEDFESGLMLYYKNDFYLARNKFSSIVKRNPTDGIARWYVFACERAFQSGGEHNPYGLFSDGEEAKDPTEQTISYV